MEACWCSGCSGSFPGRPPASGGNSLRSNLLRNYEKLHISLLFRFVLGVVWMALVGVRTIVGALDLRSTRRVQQLVKLGMPRRARGRYDLEQCTRWYITFLHGRVGATSKLDNELETAFEEFVRRK